MLKRGRKAPVKDRNADIPTAGLSTIGLKEDAVPNCLTIGHPEELAESLVRAKLCGQSQAKLCSLPEAAIVPSDSLQDLLTVEQQKSRFMSFRERFYEELYFKRAKVGEIKPAFSKPDSVTNESRTFGRPSNLEPASSLYSVIMPLKSAEQVNSEYSKFHEKRIVSHNHYFPAEQINRKYTPPFDRENPCGYPETLCDFGLMVKNCLTEGESHLKVIGKAQFDFVDRTVAPLGKKFNRYLCSVPDITFGIKRVSNGDAKMALHNIDSSDRSDLLMDAISHLNTMRLRLRKRQDIHIHNLLLILERSDPEGTGLMPLPRLVEFLNRFRIRLDDQKIRVAASHYQMIVDEGCATERVKYRDLCKLLSTQEPLPSMGGPAFYNDRCSLDTTYRLFCKDRHKKPNGDPVVRGQLVERDMTGMKDILEPEHDSLGGGLQASDFSRLRPKVEIAQIFKGLVAKDEFEGVWQSLMAKHQDQDGVASVTQFHKEMRREK